MVDTGECSVSSANSSNGKPVIVRVKRKAYQSRLEALWLEINERPLKRSVLDFEKLSISVSTGKEELKIKKIFVQHVETVRSSESTIDILHSFLVSILPSSANASKSRTKIEEQRRSINKENQKHDQLLLKAREKHEVLAKNARFEQIWRSRKGNKAAMADEPLHELCHLYDIVRVDVEKEKYNEVEQEYTSLEDNKTLCSFLPLMREFIPNAAAEIEADMRAYMSEQASADDYVYDLYTVKDDLNTTDEEAVNPYPLVQVDEEDDFYDGPIQSEFESDDSNAEDNPLNDYPDEETCEDEEELESRTSDDESEEKSTSASSKSEELADRSYHELSEDADSLYEEEIYIDDDSGDSEDWRCDYQ
ncbi:hypothetical protein HHK36_010620 [Tetracentron sinense]|uniref:Transcription factor Iwr1 domain-containing protein n=1 Tax=Tetracentron sinense TaxID=13715 RepID=A0A834ZBA1_TETSI|nr:hypothetical protein HHK36_010620 [Tetracentron sinense]